MNSARITAVALLFGAGALLAEQARRLGRARAWAACSLQAYSCERQPSRQRVILLGDSTGVGVGCASPGESIAARLAREHPQAHVTNLCVSGAVIGDVLAAATALPAEPVDLVVVLAGGNDVLRWTPLERLHEQTLDLHRLLRMRARHVVWAGMANVGRAPLFLPPFSWLLSARARAVSRLLHACAQRTGVRFVDFFRGARADLFSAKPELYYGADGVHPSAAAYAWCWGALRPAVARALDDGAPVAASRRGVSPSLGFRSQADPPAACRA